MAEQWWKRLGSLGVPTVGEACPDCEKRWVSEWVLIGIGPLVRLCRPCARRRARHGMKLGYDVSRGRLDERGYPA